MEKNDLRKNIIPVTLKNGNEGFETTDLIYLDSKDERISINKNEEDRKISATDYAKMNNIYQSASSETQTGKYTVSAWLRSSDRNSKVDYIYSDGMCYSYNPTHRKAGIVPSLHYRLDNIKKEDIKPVKNNKGEIIYYTLQIGEYPKNEVDDKQNRILEGLYNNWKLNEGMSCTGRWYSGNGYKGEFTAPYEGKHNPEFEYNGEKYVRIIEISGLNDYGYYGNRTTLEKEKAKWVKVEPISFIIKNWDNMPKSINENGNGIDDFLDLRAEEAIISNIPFYPFESDSNNYMWQNSSIRGYLNGIDVRNIKENGNLDYTAPSGGNFHNECNFLNEAFNLSREKMVEYTIPDSENKISENAFNGCLTLEKIILHEKVTNIGKDAFEGINIRYAYWNNNNELVFSKKVPENKTEYNDLIDIAELESVFDEFKYSTLIQKEKVKDLIKFAEMLKKSNFKVPFDYASKLIEKGLGEKFFENADFRFFKNEIPQLNDLLMEQPIEERLDFFKFARNLGCFSTEKMLDKKGKETEIILAQKATSVVAQLIKSNEMKLRKLS